MRFLLVLFACAALLAAQDNTGIRGRVEDPQGRTLPDAQIRLYRQDTGAAISGTTSDAGGFEFPDLEPGAFLVEVGREGFQTSTTPVDVRRGKLESVNITLHLAGVNQRVVVTADDQAQSINEVSKALSVISHDEIVNRNSYSLTDLLSTTPGLQSLNDGGPGQYTTMSIRGLPTSAGAILVDGLRFRDAATTQGDATSFLAQLNVINPDHIEILRGSGSSLYGSNAVGGAVNVVSDAGGGPTHGDFQIEGGNLGLFRTRASIGGSAIKDRLKYSAGILHLNVMSGVDGQDASRSTGLQGFARFDLNPKMSFERPILGFRRFRADKQYAHFRGHSAVEHTRHKRRACDSFVPRRSANSYCRRYPQFR